MGQINIYNDAGTGKASLTFNGSSNVAINTDNITGLTGNIQTQINTKAASSDVTSALALKANTSTVNSQVWNYSQMPAGSVIQVLEQTSTVGEVSVNGVDTTLITINITVQQNSKILAWFDSGQIYGVTSTSNPNMYVRVDGVKFTNDLNHRWYPNNAIERKFLVSHGMTNSLTSGQRTITLVANTYNGAHTFNHQGQTARLTVMEIKG